MIGKIAKLASGQMQTHVAGGGVDFVFLAELAPAAGADPSLLAAIGQANTARHVEELIDGTGFSVFYAFIANRAATTCRDHVGRRARRGRRPVRFRRKRSRSIKYCII